MFRAGRPLPCCRFSIGGFFRPTAIGAQQPLPPVLNTTLFPQAHRVQNCNIPTCYDRTLAYALSDIQYTAYIPGISRRTMVLGTAKRTRVALWVKYRVELWIKVGIGKTSAHSALVHIVVWSQRSDLNRWPAVYETAALPLSYAGLKHLTNRDT